MLLAVFTDLHANREALEACFAHAQERSAEQYAFLGDLVGYGADPAVSWVSLGAGEEMLDQALIDIYTLLGKFTFELAAPKQETK